MRSSHQRLLTEQLHMKPYNCWDPRALQANVIRLSSYTKRQTHPAALQMVQPRVSDLGSMLFISSGFKIVVICIQRWSGLSNVSKITLPLATEFVDPDAGTYDIVIRTCPIRNTNLVQPPHLRPRLLLPGELSKHAVSEGSKARLLSLLAYDYYLDH